MNDVIRGLKVHEKSMEALESLRMQLRDATPSTEFRVELANLRLAIAARIGEIEYFGRAANEDQIKVDVELHNLAQLLTDLYASTAKTTNFYVEDLQQVLGCDDPRVSRAGVPMLELGAAWRILVNGEGIWWARPIIDWNDVVLLAYASGPGSTSLTVTYKSDRASGSLLPGQRVEVEEGMVFNVARTDNA